MLREKVCLRPVLKGLRPVADNVVPIRPLKPEIAEARMALVAAAVRLCETECGGCDFTREWRDRQGMN